ncbi:MAG TPA: hypothetical protein PKV22_00100 [Paludibacteraceae bacterium]|nr:hypothetical protein [Bacteroidales bacterium]HQF10661.1 hypothetical protein [Paludibacteraceae bacterium]HQH66321.1 hypothetical protein [Clostridia bacterium]
MSICFVDTEYTDRIYLLSYAYDLRNYGQLYDNTLNQYNIERTIWPVDYLLCWGPDIGRIQNEYNILLKETTYAVNLLSVFKNYVNLYSYKLDEVERYIGIYRQYNYKGDYRQLIKDWYDPQKRQYVLLYNLQDVLSLVRIWYWLRDYYGVSLYDLRKFRM